MSTIEQVSGQFFFYASYYASKNGDTVVQPNANTAPCCATTFIFHQDPDLSITIDYWGYTSPKPNISDLIQYDWPTVSTWAKATFPEMTVFIQ
jgi:hypothetical protein